MRVKIVNMTKLNRKQVVQAAQILTDSIPFGWPTLQHALNEIDKLLIPENTLLAAVEDDILVGWGGILPAYNGNVFELHPLAVRSDKRRQGIGSAIVTALEGEARKQGGLTIYAALMMKEAVEKHLLPMLIYMMIYRVESPTFLPVPIRPAFI